LEEGKKGGRRRGGKKHHTININALAPILSFGHDVLLERVTSLHKRAIVGKWYFVEIEESEMRQ